MKKTFIAAMSAALCLSAASAFAETVSLDMLTGGTAGVYYPLGGAIAQVVTEKTAGAASPLRIQAQASGASKENVALVQSGRVQLAIAQNDTVDAAYKGVAPFAEKHARLCAVARLYPEFLHVVARADSDVKGLPDFQGKRVGVGTRNSGNEVNSRQIFRLFGMEYGLNTQKNKLTPIFLPYTETADQFKAGKVDALIFTVGTPNQAVKDLMATGNAKFVPIDGADAAKISAAFPYLVHEPIPAGTYPGQSAAVPSMSVQAILVANEDVPEEAVYLLTKTLFENLGDMAKVYPKAAEIALRHAAAGVTIPFHPGAARYLKEKGVIK